MNQFDKELKKEILKRAADLLEQGPEKLPALARGLAGAARAVSCSDIQLLRDGVEGLLQAPEISLEELNSLKEQARGLALDHDDVARYLAEQARAHAKHYQKNLRLSVRGHKVSSSHTHLAPALPYLSALVRLGIIHGVDEAGADLEFLVAQRPGQVVLAITDNGNGQRPVDLMQSLKDQLADLGIDMQFKLKPGQAAFVKITAPDTRET